MSDSASSDASERFEYPDVPAHLAETKGLGLIKYFGPGAIIASLTIGSGEPVFASRSGAVFGYAVLWLLLLTAIAKGFQVYAGARHITLTGEHPLASWNGVPQLRGWFPFFLAALTILFFPFWLGGLPKMLGTLTNWMANVSPEQENYDFMLKMWGTGFLAVGILFTLFQTYGFLEKFEAIVVGVLLVSLLAAAFASNPDWLAVFMGTVQPAMPKYPQWALEKYPEEFGNRPVLRELAVYAGAMGGGTQDYLGYVGILREKKWGLMARTGDTNPGYASGRIPLPEDPGQISLAMTWLRAPRIDVLVSFACVVVFTYTFVILGAEVLHPREIAPAGSELLTAQKDFLAQIHPTLTYLYQAGVFMAFFGTIVGAFEVYTRTAYESVIAIFPRLGWSVQRVRLITLTYAGVGALFLLWSNVNAVNIVTPAAILSSVLTCGLWCLAAVWTDHVRIPEAYRMKTGLKVALLISGLFLTILGAGAAYEFFADLLTSSG